MARSHQSGLHYPLGEEMQSWFIPFSRLLWTPFLDPAWALILELQHKESFSTISTFSQRTWLSQPWSPVLHQVPGTQQVLSIHFVTEKIPSPKTYSIPCQLYSDWYKEKTNFCLVRKLRWGGEEDRWRYKRKINEIQQTLNNLLWMMSKLSQCAKCWGKFRQSSGDGWTQLGDPSCLTCRCN